MILSEDHKRILYTLFEKPYLIKEIKLFKIL
jgi:hypothetical protein